MKRVAAATLSFLMLFGMFCTIAACGEQSDGCAHRGGKATCLEQAICEVCGEHYGTLAPHTYADEYTCHDRACLQEGCTHVEYAAGEHVVEKYACKICGEKFGCTLEILQSATPTNRPALLKS